MRVAGWVLVGLAALAAAATLDPAYFGWSTATGVAQAIGLRPWLAVGAAVLAVLGALVVWAGRRRGRTRRRIAVLAVVLALTAIGHVGVLASRGWAPGTVPNASTEAADEITVLSLNVHGGFAGAGRLVELITRSGADVVALPETAEWFRERLVERLDEAGLRFQLFNGEATGSPGRGSVLLVSEALGEYREVPTTDSGTVRVEPVGGAGPPIAVVHPISPRIGAEGTAAHMDRWRREVTAVRTLAADMPGGLIAGDVNATLDHEPLRALPGYVDAATAAGAGGVGTFPSSLPWWLSVAIDHVLVDGSHFAVTDVAIVYVAGTDHRAVIARVSLR